MTGLSWSKAKQIVRARANGHCEGCGRHLNVLSDVHHRTPRGMGGSSDPDQHNPARLAVLCRPCHDWTEAHPAAAHILGWRLWRHEHPESVPFRLHRRTLVLFTADGSFSAPTLPAGDPLGEEGNPAGPNPQEAA